MKGGHNKIQMLGRTFQGLKVLSEDGKNKCGQIQWKCECVCGKIFSADGHALRRGQTRSCGCLYLSERTTHGKTKTKIYSVWSSMRSRCTDRKHTSYDNYGARGVVVCERWASFENFFRDMGDLPFAGATLDRIDNARGYEPGNVRWATYAQQARNKSNNKLVEHKGRSLCVADWAKEFNVDRSTMSRRIQRHGTVEI